VTHLHDLFSPEDLKAATDEKHVRERFHPTEPLAILNYTEICQYQRIWTPVTTACRGLIYNTETLEVVARPFGKFFNLGEYEDFDLTRLVGASIFDKIDGSLGILYRTPSGELAISTRGSFESEQAQWATKWFHENREDWEPVDDWTYLFEIVFPSNQIVVNYGDYRGLVALAVIDTDTGTTVPGGHFDTPFDRTPAYEFDTTNPQKLLERLGEHRDNAEGYVIHLADDTRIKIKHDEYVRLHRLVTGMSERSIWDILRRGGDLEEEVIQNVPDEIYGWIQLTRDDLIAEFIGLEAAAMVEYNDILLRIEDEVKGLDPKDARRVFAREAVKHADFRAALFLLADDKPITQWVWDAIKPPANRPFSRTEDVA
jgi:RNA ligase